MRVDWNQPIKVLSWFWLLLMTHVALEIKAKFNRQFPVCPYTLCPVWRYFTKIWTTTMSWIYIKKYSINFDQTLQRHGRGIELSKNIKILVTFDLHSRSRDPRWPPNTFFKVKFGPKTTHNSANFWSNSIIFVLFCCWRPVLHFGWKSNTNNGSMCLLAPEKRPSYTTLHYYGKLHCRHFQLRMMGKLIQTVTVPPLISLQWHINAFRKLLLRAAHSVIVK